MALTRGNYSTYASKSHLSPVMAFIQERNMFIFFIEKPFTKR